MAALQRLSSARCFLIFSTFFFFGANNNAWLTVFGRVSRDSLFGFVGTVRRIIMEFAHRGSLSGVLDKEAKVSPPRGFRDEARIASVAHGVLSGLLYMHRRNVVHRDIKSDNVLIASDGTIKLADFGISRRITDADARMGTMIGTPHYLAPEVVLAENEGGYTSKVDVWSLGIVCLGNFQSFLFSFIFFFEFSFSNVVFYMEYNFYIICYHIYIVLIVIVSIFF